MEGTNNTSGFFYSYESTWGKSEVYPRNATGLFLNRNGVGYLNF
jgi:hypothetical protein